MTTASLILVINLLTSSSSQAENILSFTSTDYITTPGKITTHNFTLEAWVKPTDYQSEQQVISQYVYANGRMIMGIKNGKVGLFLGGATPPAPSWVTGNADVPLNEWTHIATVRNGTSWSFYINGELDSTKTGNDLDPCNTTLKIGRITTTSGTALIGGICDARVWNTVRNATDIQENYNKRLNGDESGLIYYWPLDEGTPTTPSTTAIDLADSADGTITGADWTVEVGPPFVIPGAPVGAWNINTGGSWSESANWLDSTVPSGNAATAYFTNQPPAAITVTNDESSLLMGQFVIEGTSSHTLTGNAITLTNGVVPSLISAKGGDHTFDLPLATTGLGLSLLTESGSSLSMDEVISGYGSVSVNQSSSDGGTVTLDAANTYTGPTELGCGTCEIGTLPNGGQPGPLGASDSNPANLILGPGTLRYTGVNVITDRGYTVNSVRAVVLDTDADITFGGPVRATAGAFVKTGAGTLSYTYPGWSKYIANEGNPNGLLNIGANGDSPTLGFSGFTIAQGRVVFGVPGQINILSNRVDIGIYTTTNANSEHSAELVINDGVFICNTTLSIGRNNGNTNTAPAGTTSKLTINGGECYLALVASGHNALSQPGFNPRSIYEINGGYVEQSSTANMGEHAGSKISMNVNGGHLNVKAAGASIRLGAGTGEGTLTMTGDAIVEATGYVILALGSGDESKGTCNLNGGTLIASDIRKGGGTSATLNFNGGVFKPHTPGETLDGLTSANISTNGALFDTSLAEYTVAQDLLHSVDLGGAPDGGLIKLGGGTLTLSAVGSTYTGPTVVSNGTLQVTGALPAGNAVTVATDGELFAGGSADKTLAIGGLTILGTGTLAFGFLPEGTSNDQIAVSGTPSMGSGQIALLRADNAMPFTLNGTYTIMTYSGGDPVVSNLTCANPVFGKSYTFAAAGGTLTVTIATDTTGASVWNVDAAGNWADDANWTQPQPGTAGSSARFDDAISAPAAVTTAGESVGTIYFNSPFAYTIDGTGMIIDNAPSEGLIAVESGTHSITAPLTLAGNTAINLPGGTRLNLGALGGGSSMLSAEGEGTLALTTAPSIQTLNLNVPLLELSAAMTLASALELERTVSVAPAANTSSTIEGAISGGGALIKTGSSILEATADNSYAGPTTISAGTLKVATISDGGSSGTLGAAPADPANLILGKGTLHITGTGTTDRGYTVRTDSSAHAAVLRVEEEFIFGGQIRSDSGAFLKTGPGTIRYTYPGVNKMHTHDAGRPGTIQNIGAYGNAPTEGITGFTVTQGTVVFGAPGQTNQVNRIDIGLYTSTAPGGETAGEIIVNDGVLHSIQTVSIGRNNGTATTAPGGLSSRLIVNGGICNFPILATGNNGAGLSGYNARPVIEVTGGEVNVGGNYLSVGESQGSSATLLVSGGKVNIWKDGGTLRTGGWISTANGGDGTVRLSGDGVILVNGNVEIGYGLNSQAAFHLDGGTLEARNIIGLVGNLKRFFFNGGIFRPRTAGQTMSGLSAAYVSTNGAAIDTALASYTIAQALVTDPALGGAIDGGLTKLGSNTLTLTSAGNTFNGPVRVTEGTLSARLGGTNDLDVTAGATFDALAENCVAGALSGEGALINGTVTVHGALDCGDSGAAAGAAMTAENLNLAAGATFVCDWTTNALGEVISDTVTVSGNLAANGPGWIDFNRDGSDPVPVPFETEIMSYGTFSGTFRGWKAVNTGVPEGQAVTTMVTAKNGVVTVRLMYGGTLILLR